MLRLLSCFAAMFLATASA